MLSCAYHTTRAIGTLYEHILKSYREIYVGDVVHLAIYCQTAPTSLKVHLIRISRYVSICDTQHTLYVVRVDIYCTCWPTRILHAQRTLQSLMHNILRQQLIGPFGCAIFFMVNTNCARLASNPLLGHVLKHLAKEHAVRTIYRDVLRGRLHAY